MASSGRGEIGRQANLTGESASDQAGRIKATSKYAGGHQRSHHRQLCLQHAAHSPVQHRRGELTGKRLSALEPDPRLTRRRFVNTLRNKPPEHPKEDSSPRQSEEGLGVGTRALTTTSSTSHVTRHHREDRATSRGAGAQDIQQQHRSSGRLSRLLLRTNTLLGRRLTYVSKVKSVRRSNSRLSHFGSLCS